MTTAVVTFKYGGTVDGPSDVTSNVTYTGVVNNQAVFTMKRPLGWEAVDVLVVAGGGGGGQGAGAEGGGGGGAGGLIYRPGVRMGDAVLATIRVGNGGAPGVNGSASEFTNEHTSIVAVGGGCGGMSASGSQAGSSGGSGGGARGAGSNQPGGSGTAEQGSAGGLGYWFSGGGGFRGAGATGGTGQQQNVGGGGGPGRACNITGANVFYAGGGGGGSVTASGTRGNGGIGGGGNGGGSSTINGSAGSPHTGGGGGGSVSNDTGYGGNASAVAGAGGSGIVILRLCRGTSFQGSGPQAMSAIRARMLGNPTPTPAAPIAASYLRTLYGMPDTAAFMVAASTYDRSFSPSISADAARWVRGALDHLPASSRPAVAIASRRLFTEYDGPHMRIRRSTDSTSADVYFNASGAVRRLTQASQPTQTLHEGDDALTTFLAGGATAFVDRWFDQSGNGHDMTMHNSPVLQVHGSSVAVRMNGTNQRGACTTATVSALGISGNAARSILVESVNTSSGNNNGGLFAIGDAGVTGREFGLRLAASFVAYRAQMWGTPDLDFAFDGRDDMVMYALTHDGSTTQTFTGLEYRNGKSNSLVTGGALPLEIGRWTDGSTSVFYGGLFRSLMLFVRALPQSDVQLIYRSLY